MNAICVVGGIDQSQDTVIHNSLMDGKEMKRVLYAIKMEWRRRFVMTNSSVTDGINFDVNNWFHRLFACVSGFQSPREIVQWLSRARHIIDNQVCIVKTCPICKPKLIPDVLEDDPVFTKMVNVVNAELSNGSRGVLECFAVDAGYNIEHVNANLSSDVMGQAENADMHEDLEIIWENIESMNNDEEYKENYATWIATCAEMLATENSYFKQYFRADTDENTLAYFWDFGLATSATILALY
jgi:hypothetical protein